MTLSATTENYLKCIFNLSLITSEVSITDVAEKMHVALPSVNNMVKKLAGSGWIKYSPYKPIRITPKGKKTAANIIRRHRLVEMFLVEKMHFGWHEVHHIAEQMEHVNSPVFFDRIDQLLGYPKADPHGSPIPDKNGNIQMHEYKLLSDCTRGSYVRVMALQQSDEMLLQMLLRKQISIGSKLKIVDVEEYDGSITISQSGLKSTVLSKSVCDKLLVE